MKRYSTLYTVFVIAGAVFLCAQMSAELSVRGCRRAAEAGGLRPQRPRTAVSLFIGELDELVGNVLLLKADSCFHGQTSLLGETRVGACDAMSARRGDSRAREHDGGHGTYGHCHECEGGHDAHGAGGLGNAALGYDHFLYRQYVKVASTAHVHLKRHEEIVPWLYASVTLNPGNERAAVVTAYWLGRQLGKPREAEQVLRAALGVQPSSWRLHAELGWLHYHQKRHAPALRQASSAITLFEPGEDADQARLDLAELWRLAGACQEALGDLDRAVACAEQVVALVPESPAAHDRLERLRATREASRAGLAPEAASPLSRP
ncbi:MAG: tetratricopeptide repeat protein [Verrucomicrobia bacterium]|nr:tetratricopeptide repeat protein [Verrucomicrobiota bacterium]